MAAENEMKIIFGADTAPLRNEVSKASDSVEKFADDVDKAAQQSAKGFDNLKKSVNGIPEAFNKVAGGSVVLSKIAGNLQSAGQAAINSSKAFQALEGAPLQTITKLDAAIKVVKATLANGFKASLDTSGLSSQAFANVAGQAKNLDVVITELALSLSESVVAAKSLGTAFEKQFSAGISEELQRAGVSVAQFKDALSSLTGVGGANLAPLIQALDSIQSESTGTTTAIKSIGGALQGVSVLAKAPINDLVKLDQELKVVKATLASGFKPSIEKINLSPGDFSGIKNEINASNESVERFGQTVKKTVSESINAVDSLKDVAQTIPAAFDKAAASAKGLNNIGQSIEQAGEAAAQGARDFSKLGNLPLADLRNLDKELRTIRNTLGSGFKPAIANISLIPANFSRATQAANTLTGATNKLKGSSTAATLALTDVSRVAQDLPFGFLGIANNLNPMIDSFARLKRETGSTGGALKALVGSLTGAGGLGLAIGVISSAFLIYQNGIMGFGRKTQEAKDSFEDFKKSLRDSATISGDAAASVQEEILKVGALAKVITDVNRSTSERKRALTELQSVNKSYFGDLTLESSALGKLTSATEEYTKALINQAVAKGFADEISKVSSELFKQERILQKVAKGFTDAQNAANQKTNARAASLGESRTEFAERQTKEETNAFNQQAVAVGELRNTLFDLKNGYTAAIEAGLKVKDLNTGGAGSKKEVDLLKQRKEVLEQIVALERQGLNDKEIFVTDASLELKNLEIKLINRDFKGSEEEKAKLIKQMFPDFDGSNLTYSKPIVVTASVQFKGVSESVNNPIAAIGKTFEQQFPAIAAQFQKQGETLRLKFLEPLKKLEADLTSIMGSAFQGIGEAIGESLSGSINPAQAFVQVIAEALQQIGRALIAYGIATEAFQKAMKAGIFGNPFVAIAAGIGAIAVGKLLQARLAKTTKFAEGGLVMGPTRALLGEAGPEMVIPLNRANQFMENAGSNGFVAETALRGRDLVLLIRREIASQSKTGGLNF